MLFRSQPGERGHKTLLQDLNDILVSAGRAIELEERRMEILDKRAAARPQLGPEVFYATR